MSDFVNSVNIVFATKGEKSIIARGTFQCGISFPRNDGEKPFKVIERTSKNGKTFKQIRTNVVIVPDDRKNDSGYAYAGVYYDGKSMTFKEFLAATGVELFNEKLYAGVYMDRNAMGLYQVMGDPNLTFKQNIILSGDLSIYTGNDGKVRAAFNNVSLFAKDHVSADKVEKENANCMLDSGTATAASGTAAPAAAQQSYTQSGSFVNIDEEDEELPF